MICKTLHRKLKIEHSEHHQKPRVNSGALEGKAVPAPLVTPVMLLLNCKLLSLSRNTSIIQ